MSILDWYKEREKFRMKFYKEKRYLKSIEDIVKTDIHNDDYEGNWTDEIDEIFSFLYYNAYDIMPFEEEVIIKYKDKYISLFQIHGQGTFRRISTVEVTDKESIFYVDFFDIVKYYETGEKPFRSYALDIFDKAIEIFQLVTNSSDVNIDGKNVNLDELKHYVYNNLK